MVVAAVVPVLGLSPEEFDIPEPTPEMEDGGKVPVISRRRILDFSSSSSSHTVPEEMVDMMSSFTLPPTARFAAAAAALSPSIMLLMDRSGPLACDGPRPI